MGGFGSSFPIVSSAVDSSSVEIEVDNLSVYLATKVVALAPRRIAKPASITLFLLLLPCLLPFFRMAIGRALKMICSSLSISNE